MNGSSYVPGAETIEDVQRIEALLKDLLAQGGRSDASDPPPAWLAPFLEDADPADTLNAAIENGYVALSHDASSGASAIVLTPVGRAMAQSDRSSEAYHRGHGHGNNHDKVMDPLQSYTHQEKFDYWLGFQAGRDAWVKAKSNLAWKGRDQKTEGNRPLGGRDEDR